MEMLEFCFLYVLNWIVVIAYFALASTSFFVFKSLSDYSKFNTTRDVLSHTRDVLWMMLHKKDLIKFNPKGWNHLYIGVGFLTTSSFAFGLMNLKYLLDGDIVYVGSGTTLAWFTTHFIKITGTLFLWLALYGAIENGRSTGKTHKVD